MTNEKIKTYWNERARANADCPQATTDDVYLRELEARVLVDTVASLVKRKEASFLDIGCGDGKSILEIAPCFPSLAMQGVDYSESMIANADANLGSHADLKARICFQVADVTELKKDLDDQLFDITHSDRCLINLDSPEAQAKAIEQIAMVTKPGGFYIAIENFIEGNNNLNAARREFGLDDISIRWHNRFFTEEQFLAAADPYFELIETKDFSSSYYLATRVLYSAMCKEKAETPDYNHDIHRLAVHLPWSGQFSPIRMVVLRRRQEDM